MNKLKKNNEMQKIYYLYCSVLIIALIGLIVSIIIQVEHRNYELHKISICSAITNSNGCEVVQTSKYGSIFGISNAIYGIIGFTLIILFSILLILKHKQIISLKNKNIITYLTISAGIAAGIIAIGFIYTQAVILKTYCIFCLVVDISSLILLGITIYWIYLLKQNKK